jgi:hypothetical protein
MLWARVLREFSGYWGIACVVRECMAVAVLNSTC